MKPRTFHMIASRAIAGGGQDILRRHRANPVSRAEIAALFSDVLSPGKRATRLQG